MCSAANKHSPENPKPTIIIMQRGEKKKKIVLYGFFLNSYAKTSTIGVCIVKY